MSGPSPEVARLVTWCAVAALGLAAACGPSNSDLKEKANYHYKLASNFFYDDNPQSAVAELFTALAADPAHSRAHHLLGFIYFGRQDYARALKHLQTALHLDPEYDEAIANMGNLQLALEQWEASLRYFEKLLDKPLYRTPYLAHNNLGWAKYKLSRFNEAKRHFEMAIFLNPTFCLAHNNLGRLHAHLGETDKALEKFQKAIQHCPGYLEPHYFLGRIYGALSAPDRARKHFKTCRDLGPDTPYGKRCGEAL